MKVFKFAIFILLTVNSILFPGNILSDGIPILKKDDINNYISFGNNTEINIINIKDMPFSNAFNITTHKIEDHIWSSRIIWKINKEIKKDDIIAAVFYIKPLKKDPDSNQLLIRLCYEKDGFPYTKSIYIDVNPNSEWTKFIYPFRIKENYKPGESTIGFHLGEAQQQFNLGGINLLHYSKEYNIEDFENIRSKITYEGRNIDAEWRKKAEERINQIRKEKMKILIKDKNGNKLKNVNIKINMLRHNFNFGTAITKISWKGWDNVNYKKKIKELFNCTVIANALKWPFWINPEYKEAALEMTDYLNANNINIRGHVLIWPSWKHLPEGYENKFKDNPELLKNETLKRIKEISQIFDGKLIDWDVINEPYDNNDLMNILGNDVMIDWFNEARKNDQSAKLYINDYDILVNSSKAHREHYYNTIEYLINNNAPIDGIGLQAHFGENPTSPEIILKRLDLLKKFGKEIKITEYDLAVDDLELQKDYLRDIMTAAFSHPCVNGFIFWGFWENSIIQKNSALYTGNWQIKPAGEIYKNLVFNKWWTKESGKTDNNGCFETNGFLGDYEIEVYNETKNKKVNFNLKKDKNIIEIIF